MSLDRYARPYAATDSGEPAWARHIARG